MQSVSHPHSGWTWPTPRSAYIHVPFCRHRCGYCNFSVIADRDDLVQPFLTAIDRELAQLDRPRIDTLFLGGGTPTHLDAAQLEWLLQQIELRFSLTDQAERSVEANPEDIDEPKLRLLADHGINRISLGVQSFNPQKLKVLQRSHTAAQAAAAIELAAKWIGNVSIDLIFAAPQETVSDWQADLQTALDLPINHLSTYALTFEKGTAFWTAQRAGRLDGVDEATEVAMYTMTRERSSARGLRHYEISNFARAGFRCRHNLAYWQGRGWYAAGPGAARFVNGHREVNHRSTTTYLKRIERNESPVAESDAITPLQYARERAAFGIRMIDGIDIAELARETKIDLHSECGDAIEKLMSQGLLQRQGNHIRLSEQGILFADSVASELLG
ncbi:oxygen-independent coproporphyrinogen III oxidase [Rhodopirellula maiorica SM1]|uniref:Heme chaperone HemW n=1 Tax=Rhodopirellula maiorica SM1 TaxID=1265738 RepID=M5RYT7_9BACT|nr:radical SAM family heme chaperone HemW [Rhodopirellula maiorica]EMI19094.1 oxygen-independent coproporphyrinogen III oxidase [Rhodopirellula maiorica SM1]